MATIINNPGDGNNSGAAAGWLVALVVLILVVLGVIFLLPRLMNTPAETAPQGTNQNNDAYIPPVMNVTTVNSTTTITGSSSPL